MTDEEKVEYLDRMESMHWDVLSSNQLLNIDDGIKSLEVIERCQRVREGIVTLPEPIEVPPMTPIIVSSDDGERRHEL